MKRIVIGTLWIAICVALTAAIILAVADRRPSLQWRLEHSRGMNRMPATSSSTSPSYSRQVRSRLVDALSAATLQSLQEPTLVVFGEQRMLGNFFVQWIEDKPSPDAIWILSSTGDVVQVSGIDEVDRQANRESAESDIVYAAIFTIPPERQRLAARAVLARDGKRVSNEVDILRSPAPTSLPVDSQ